MKGCLLTLLFTLFFPIALAGASRIDVYFVPGLSADNLKVSPYRELAEHGQIALMSWPTGELPRTPYNAMNVLMHGSTEKNLPPENALPALLSHEILTGELRFLSNIKELDPQKSVTYLISPWQPRGKTRLCLLILLGPGIAVGTLSSPTTRTPGLISNVDIAPTILTELGKPIPPTMTGNPILCTPNSNSVAALLRLDGIISLNGRALVPIFCILGGMITVIGIGGICMLRGRPRTGPWFAFGVLVMMNMGFALLGVVMLAQWFHITRERDYGLCLIGLMIFCALAEVVISRRINARAIDPERSIPLTTLWLLAGFTITAILLDTITGQNCIKFSLLSGYQLSGIRFYGMGNEYMGFLLGMSLLWAFLSGKTRLRQILIALVFVSSWFIISLPAFGAKGGGAITGVVAFGLAWIALQGRKITWKSLIGLITLGMLSAFGIALLERYLGGTHSSHIGGALKAADSRGFSYLLAIIERKALMNLHITFAPGMLWSYAGITAAVYAANRLIGKEIQRLISKYPEWVKAWPVVCCSSLIALIFNDSGAVAAIFLFGVFFASGLFLLFEGTSGTV